MEMDVKNMEITNGAKKTEIIMAKTGRVDGSISKNGPIAREDLLWSVLNVDAVSFGKEILHAIMKSCVLKSCLL